MSFEKLIRIPNDRIGALIGKSGKTKKIIEDKCSVKLDIDSDGGQVIVKSEEISENFEPFKAVEIITAIGRGFSPEISLRLLKGENSLHVIDLREFVGKSTDQIERIKGRIIGEGGKARLNIENLTNASVTVYGRTVAIIGEPNQLRLAVDAISSLSNGSMHGPVYTKLESARRREKADKAKIWEDQDVF
jgi:ribosomal RNA assembly protein|tara:strand:- start:175 stop:744 length:570 start_codon:yes stop_codon:yes gene_type:complete